MRLGYVGPLAFPDNLLLLCSMRGERERESARLYYPFPVPEMALLSITHFCNSKVFGLIRKL